MESMLGAEAFLASAGECANKPQLFVAESASQILTFYPLLNNLNMLHLSDWEIHKLSLGHRGNGFCLHYQVLVSILLFIYSFLGAAHKLRGG